MIITSIPGLITGVLIYKFAGGRIENEMVQLHKNQIARRAEQMDSQLSFLELSLSHWAFDTKFDYGLKETDFFKQFQSTKDLTKTLLLMQGSLPLTRRIELYAEGLQTVHFDPEFSLVTPDSEPNSEFRRLLAGDGSVYWTQLPAGERKEIALVQKIPGTSPEPFGVLVARLDRDRLSELLKTLAPYDDGEALLLDAGGKLLAAAGSSALPAGFQELLLKEAARRAGTEPSFLLEVGRSTYSVSTGTFGRIASDWTYVSAAPINAMTAPVLFLSKVIAAVSAAGLLLAAILAWFASNRIYLPLGRLLRMLTEGSAVAAIGREDEFKLIEKEWRQLSGESLALRHKLEDQLPQVREGFLLQLVYGYLSASSEEDLRRRMRQYGWAVEDRVYRVLVLQLTGMTQADQKGRFSPGDEGLVTFAAANMIGELAAERFNQAEVINFHNLTVGLLLLMPAERSSSSAVYELADSLTQAVNRMLKMRVTLSIAAPTAEVKAIPAQFDEARIALSYRMFGHENQLIDLELRHAGEPERGFQYPFAEEREMIQAMRTGRQAEAEAAVSVFLQALTTGGAKEVEVQQGLLNLLGSLQHAAMQSGLSPAKLFKGSNPFEQLASIHEEEQIRSWFVSKVIRPYITAMEERSDDQVKKMIEEAMLYMQEHYRNDISLDELAEHCGTNVFMLSRSFKQVTGKNFIDYLTELRMAKAKELLRNSERKINDIAEQVGYQHSYFNRIFKKYEGITPTRYRENSRT
ncbi:helix-turn-helix domain-containing protein [Paenibacillus filicis]|uniref:Helix-turn-helix domain-containing protein n=1 Tax=Paenibacillus gyeongsangnamensis TaxID=3388067 RepID=A0ABT4Q309_9BACL|nr:helix-turn-helix domain-containing protein [Paenibacillus filicis]MCZ8511090.1 helix-turn-helix domain-containing protein [Paenibacillus filicis]